MKVICTEKTYEGWEVSLFQDENGEYVIISEINGEIFRTASKERAETRFYNVVMARF